MHLVARVQPCLLFFFLFYRNLNPAHDNALRKKRQQGAKRGGGGEANEEVERH